MGAVAAFIGTAALAVVLTRAPANNDVSLSSEVSGRVCSTSGLEAWLGAAGAADVARSARETSYALEFTNVSGRACSLYGYPEVSAYRDSAVAGGPIGDAAIRDTSVRPRPVMLEPGATAHAVLRVTAATRPAGCAEVTAEELQVRLPRQDRPSFVPVNIPVCSQRGHVSLSVQAIQARPGVPGRVVTP